MDKWSTLENDWCLSLSWQQREIYTNFRTEPWIWGQDSILGRSSSKRYLCPHGESAAAAAAAKSLQSYPTLCDPIDGRPPGSPGPGILQARTLEWVAIFFSSSWKWKVKEVTQSCLTLSDLMDCSPLGSSVHGIFPGKSTGVGCHRLLWSACYGKLNIFYSSLKSLSWQGKHVMSPISKYMGSKRKKVTENINSCYINSNV